MEEHARNLLTGTNFSKSAVLPAVEIDGQRLSVRREEVVVLGHLPFN